MFATSKDTKLNAAKDGMLNEGGNTADNARGSEDSFRNGAPDVGAAKQNDWESIAKRTGHRAREWIDSSGHNFANAGETLKTRVQDNPIQSSLIALGLGLVIGKLFRR